MSIVRFRLAGRNTVARPPVRWRMLALVACTAAVSGCQFFADFTGAPPQSTPPIDRLSSETEIKNLPIVLDQAAVRDLQASLTELGFEPGPVDGVVGPRTSAAIKRFQSEHRLAPTGTISPRLLEQLDSALTARGAGRQTTINLRPDEYPAYQPGVFFVFSDGNVDYVSQTDGRTVEWVRNKVTTYTANRNFLLPWARWESHEMRGTATISHSADALWPKYNGAEVAFSADLAVQNRNDPDTTERRRAQWLCRNHGRRDITTQAGSFDTIVIACRRTVGADDPVVARTWYYAKSVRHYVRVEENDAEGKRISSADLVTVQPSSPAWPPIVRAALARATVHALEANSSDSKIRWASSVVNAQVTVEAKSQFTAPDGRLCRRFVQHWSEDDRHWQYPAVACKTEHGEWRVPGLGNNSANLTLAYQHSS